MALVLIAALLILAPWILGGCSTVGKIKTKAATVLGVKDAGKPASLVTEAAGMSLPIPAGSRVVMTKFQPTEPVPATDHTPAVAAQPAREVTEIVLQKPTELRKTETKIAADTGTVDVSVAKHRIDVQSRQWLLVAMIVCGVVGLVARSMLPAWPAISNGLLMAAVAAGLAWKMAEIPAYLWVAILGGVAILVLGYKRREKDEKEEAAKLQTNP